MRIRSIGAAPALAVLSLYLSACDPTAPSASHSHAMATEASVTGGSADLNRQLAALRRLVAPFHNFDRAQAAGWSAEFTPCL